MARDDCPNRPNGVGKVFASLRENSRNTTRVPLAARMRDAVRSDECIYQFAELAFRRLELSAEEASAVLGLAPSANLLETEDAFCARIDQAARVRARLFLTAYSQMGLLALSPESWPKWIRQPLRSGGSSSPLDLMMGDRASLRKLAGVLQNAR